VSDHIQVWDQYAEGLQLGWSFSVSDEDMRTYGKLIGDFNPVHTDTEFAKVKGFDAPLIYGMLLSGQMSRLIGQELPDKHAILTGVRIDFIQPGYAGDELRFDAELTTKSDSSGGLEFKCRITRADKLLCRGKVMAVWKP
jgi:3-hydroxybutyryl-CoA dehydratase